MAKQDIPAYHHFWSNASERNDDEKLKNYVNSPAFTPQEYHQLMLDGIEGGSDMIGWSLSGNPLVGHPHTKDTSLNDQVLKDALYIMHNEDKRPKHFEDWLEHAHLSERGIHNLLDNYKGTKRNAEGPDNLSDKIAAQPNLKSDHINKLLNMHFDKGGARLDGYMLKHPEFKAELIDKMLGKFSRARGQDNSLENKIGNRGGLKSLAKNPNFTPEHARKVLDILNRNGSASVSSLEDLKNHLDPAAVKDQMDKILGITGGKHIDKEKAGDKEENFQNWEHGPHRNENLDLENVSILSPDQQDHVMRHGSLPHRWQLFNNKHVDPAIHQKQYEKWTGDHSDHGYDESDLKDHLKSQHEDNIYDSEWRDKADEEAREEYPMADYMRDSKGDDLLDHDGGREGWIDDKLDEQDWMARNPENPNEFIDYQYNKADHPQYQERYNAADADADKAIENRISNPDDSDYENYDNHLSDNGDIWGRARDLMHQDVENWNTSDAFMPKHAEDSIPEIAEAKFERRLQESEDARKEAKNLPSGVESHLNEQVPKRKDKHAYGQNQHYMEMVKKYADANNGSIDIGHLNRMHPNQKEIWKQIFDGKGKIDSDEIKQKIKDLPKDKYDISYGQWTHNLQNINNRPQTIMRLDHSKSTEGEIAKDPELHKFFKQIQDVSQRSGHPTNKNSIAWARIDTSNPKHWMVDELQSDFSSTLRRALEEEGDPKKAEMVKKIEAHNKNWRETLLNHITKMAERNGVEKVSTHSPESKAAHTGADKVHSVYKDSYGKVPKAMGFKQDDYHNLPLNPHGKQPFEEGFSSGGESVADKIDKHKEALTWHAVRAGAHNYLLNHKAVEFNIAGEPFSYDIGQTDMLNPEVGEKWENHSRQLVHHKDMAEKHRKAIERMDPLHPYAKAPTVGDIDKFMETKPAEGIKAIKEAAYSGSSAAQGPEMHSLDENLALEQKPIDSAKVLPAHTLDLRPEAFKKNEMEIADLIKAEGYKMGAAAALHKIKQLQPQIEAIKDQNPAVYQSILALTRNLTKIFNTSHKKTMAEHVDEHSAKQHLENVQAEHAAMHVPAQSDPITHGKLVYGQGAIREYDNKTERQKDAQGDWHSVSSGLKTRPEQ